MKLNVFCGRHAGLTRLELTVVLAILAVLAMLVLSSLTRARARSSRVGCTSHLAQIGLGFRGWAQDYDDLFPFQVPGLTNLETGVMISSNAVNARAWMHFLLLSNELNTARVLTCPLDRARLNHRAEDFSTNQSPRGLAHPDSRDAAISYFVGLAGGPAAPQAILSGDRNIAAAEASVPYGVGSSSGAVVVPNTAMWSVAPGHQLHGYQGNLLMADGSVQQVSSLRLQTNLTASALAYGSNANVFLFPR